MYAFYVICWLFLAYTILTLLVEREEGLSSYC